MQENIIHTTNDYPEEEDFSFSQLFQQWSKSIRFALSFWRILLIAGLLGAGVAALYAILQSPTYTARLTFVMEESKMGGGSLASALVGTVGLDIGGLSGGGGILSGDNVLELLKSHSLIKRTLLTPYNDSSTFSLADEYAESNHWKEKWRNSSKTNHQQINFPVNQKHFTRVEDSLLNLITERIAEKELSVSKPDKKLGIFELLMTTSDEKLSQLFCERILSNTTDFYIETKTGRLRKNVAKLEARADSIGRLLNRKTYSNAESNLMLLNGNPAYSSAEVSTEISSRDKFMIQTIYAEIIKNLEITKTALIQETPTIQVVDVPELPLKKNKISLLPAIILGFVIATFSTACFFVLVKK